MNRLAVVCVIASVIFLIGTIELVRRRTLREEYSILWLFGSVVLLVLSLRQDWLNRISAVVGISYPPSFLFLFGIFLILMILVHFSIVISRLIRMNKKLTQEMALIKYSLQKEELSQFSKEQKH